jgi:hypothetical protein
MVKSEDPTHQQIKQQLHDSSRALADLTANMVYDNPSLLKLLVEVAHREKDPMAQRASHVVSICCCRFPELFKPFSARVVRDLKSLKSEGSLRNFLKIFAETPIHLSVRNKSLLLNHCFDYLTGPYPPSIKVYSMDILYHLGHEHPEIRRELYHIIEDKLPDSSAGFKSRGQKVLRKISRDPGFE